MIETDDPYKLLSSLWSQTTLIDIDKKISDHYDTIVQKESNKPLN